MWMQRVITIAIGLAVVLSSTGAEAGTRSGRVEAPTASPTPARTAYLFAGAASNGPVGWVIDLGSLPDRSAFTLTKTSSLPAELDVWFYRSIGGAGDPCRPNYSSDGAGGLRGTVTCDGAPARYAVVFLFYGAHVDFRLSW